MKAAELYDPTTGLWSVTGDLANRRKYHSATMLLDGRVLVTGGIIDWTVLFSRTVSLSGR